MMKKTLAFVFTLLTAAPVTAQTVVTPLYRLAWEQDVPTTGTITWEISVDSESLWAPVLGTSCTGLTVATCTGALPQSLTDGNHTLYIRTIRTLDGARYISATPNPSVTFTYLGSPNPTAPRNFRPILPPNSAQVSVSGEVLSRGFAFGQDVATNRLDGVPNFPFYFGAQTLETGTAYGAPKAGDQFYLVLWRP